MPPYSAQHTPISNLKHLCFSLLSPLVNALVVCVLVGMYSRSISSFLTFCCRKWYCTLMCFVRSWNSGFLVMVIADWLSMWRIVGEGVETDRPSRPYRLYGLSRSGVSYMLQIILRTNQTVMDCQKLLYTLSLYGHMLIIAIIVLILYMSIVLNFYCSLLWCRLLYDRTSYCDGIRP